MISSVKNLRFTEHIPKIFQFPECVSEILRFLGHFPEILQFPECVPEISRTQSGILFRKDPDLPEPFP